MSQNPQIILDCESAPVTARSLPAHVMAAESYHNDEKPHDNVDFDEKADATETNVNVLAAGSMNNDVETPDEGEPTAHELETLRKVSAPMKWAAMAMCIIELAERASYYGSKG
ncbi:hypothetical protein QFC22_002641 [Naganishia vaughanmartiniae]|uniref:Uncharacterized protein n=1 Tax=Naganishia vaughanmartiniae TaxID=1424756 RepID=A0ACC2XAV5_9TREE|nr:hypothetical protein QFC22_002641 [Naganishia vaughanmartiniae]